MRMSYKMLVEAVGNLGILILDFGPLHTLWTLDVGHWILDFGLYALGFESGVVARRNYWRLDFGTWLWILHQGWSLGPDIKLWTFD